LLTSAVITRSASAQLNDDDLVGARAEGMAGAFRALAFDNSALDLNPAGMAQVPRLSLDIGYRLDIGPDASRFQISLVDALSSKVAGGVGYSFETADTPDSGTKAKGQRVVSGFGFPLGTDKLFFGFNLRYVRLDYPEDSAISDLKAFTADAGVLARPVKFVAIGAAVNNIVDADRPELPLNAGGGIALLIPGKAGAPLAMIGADFLADFGSEGETRTGWATGAQLSITQSLWLRAGYNTEPVSGRRWAAGGLSYVGTQWGLDYSFRVPTQGGDSRHSINVNILVF
jgi:hypothetical protein